MSTLKRLHSQARSRRQGRPAFTPLEIIVILLVLGILAAILGILAAIAVPTFNAVKTNSVKLTSYVFVIVCIAASHSSSRLKHEIRRREFRKDTSESASKDATGWLPLRDSHYVRGVVALISSILLPLMLAGAIVAGTEDPGYVGPLVLVVYGPGVVVLTLITYILGRNVLRMAGEFYDWPARPAYGTHPALKFARTLQQTQFVLIWCWLVLVVLQFMG